MDTHKELAKILGDDQARKIGNDIVRMVKDYHRHHQSPAKDKNSVRPTPHGNQNNISNNGHKNNIHNNHTNNTKRKVVKNKKLQNPPNPFKQIKKKPKMTVKAKNTHKTPNAFSKANNAAVLSKSAKVSRNKPKTPKNNTKKGNNKYVTPIKDNKTLLEMFLPSKKNANNDDIKDNENSDALFDYPNDSTSNIEMDSPNDKPTKIIKFSYVFII